MKPESLHALMSGEWRGVIPSCLRGFLTLGSVGYEAAVRVRNGMYDRGWVTAQRVDVPVVSVGNITAGGTGKTPCVAYLVEWFLRQHCRVAILSRGYRALPNVESNRDDVDASRNVAPGNDELLLLNQLCPGVPHLQAADRVEIARRAIREFESQVLILDDGFQHRRLSRQLDLVLIDGLNPWGHGRLLPRGLLREPRASLKRADLVLLTRADLCDAETRRGIRETLQILRGANDLVEVAFPPSVLLDRNQQTVPLESLRSQPILAVSAIGNPVGFEQTLARLEYQMVGRMRFPDHHHYTDDDLLQVEREARQKQARAIVMTEKDLVKIPAGLPLDIPLWCIRLETRVISGEELLHQRLQEIVELTRTRRD